MYPEIDEGALHHRPDLVQTEIDDTMSLAGSTPVAYSPRERGDLHAFDRVWRRLKLVGNLSYLENMGCADCVTVEKKARQGFTPIPLLL